MQITITLTAADAQRLTTAVTTTAKTIPGLSLQKVLSDYLTNYVKAFEVHQQSTTDVAPQVTIT